MKKRSFRERLYCSVAAILSLFIVCSNNLHAANITYDPGILDATATGLLQTQTVVAGSTVTFTDMGAKASNYVLIGWHTLKMPFITTLAMENMVKAMSGPGIAYYEIGYSSAIEEDMTLYAVWAVDWNNDGRQDYGSQIIRPTISSVFGSAGIPPFEDDDDGLSLRSLPAWNNNYDLTILDDSVYYVGCSYIEDNLIYLTSGYTFDTLKARPLIPMDFIIEYDGVLEENSMIGGQAQKPLSKIEITAAMIAGGTFYIDTLIDKYPFMFSSIKKDGQGILKMYFLQSGTKNHPLPAHWFTSSPYSGSAPFRNPETGAYMDTLTIKFNIYNKPEFKSEIISQRVDTAGRIDLKHVSGTPLKYMMRCINELRWRPAESPLSNAEKGEIGDNINICLREMDRTTAYQQLIIRDFLSDEFSKPSHPNYGNYHTDLTTYYMEHYCDSIWENYFVTDPSYFTPISGIKATYDMFMAMPNATHQMAIQLCIIVFEGTILATDTHYTNANVDALSTATAMMPAYGRYLASQVVIPAPCRGTFCFTFDTRTYPEILREVYIPQAAGVTIDPGYGLHYVASQSDFKFSAKYAGQPLKVTTNRIVDGEVEELVGTPNADGGYDYIIKKVSQKIVLTFGPDYATSNTLIEGRAVWAYNNTINIRVTKADMASIYSMAGQMMKRIELPEGDTSVSVEPGTYIVVLKDGTVYKVVVK